MNDLKVFSNTEFGELGVMLIDGKEYFPATQCAKILGYKNPQEAIRDKCKGVRKTLTPTNGGSQTVNYIPEGDLYRLIVSSKLPAAEKFERWVFDEVLPSIRRNGAYGGINIEELITKTVSAVVTEVMKQLAPVVVHNTSQVTVTAPEPKKYKKPRKAVSKISKLDPFLKNSVNDMLISEKYTLQEICEYLSNVGVTVSAASVCRYNKRLHSKEEF